MELFVPEQTHAMVGQCLSLHDLGHPQGISALLTMTVVNPGIEKPDLFTESRWENEGGTPILLFSTSSGPRNHAPANAAPQFRIRLNLAIHRRHTPNQNAQTPIR